MKNKGLYILISILLLIFIICLFFYNKFIKYDIDSKVFDNKWYHYNYNDNTYSVLDINNGIFNYYDSSISESKSCSKYEYNRKTKTFKLDCNIDFQIEEINTNNMIVFINGKKKIFYDSIDDSLNNEFESFFSKTISEYRKETINTLDIIKIDYNKLNEYLYKDDESIFVFMGNKCTSIECSILSSVIEKWMSKTNNVFYIDSDSVKEKVIFNDINKEEYNSNYPFIIFVKNNNVIKKFNINCNGFNCEKYYDLDM